MPKLVVTNSKGLFQKAGTGGAVGLERVVYVEDTIAAAPGNNDTSVDIPANSLITEIGFVVIDKLQKTGSGTDLNIGYTVGNSAGGADYVASAVDNIVDGSDPGLVAGTAFILNVCSGTATARPDATTDALIKADAPLFSTSARTIHLRIIIDTATLSQAGKVIHYVKYTTLDTSESAGV